jgi:hypothetical protein
MGDQSEEQELRARRAVRQTYSNEQVKRWRWQGGVMILFGLAWFIIAVTGTPGVGVSRDQLAYIATAAAAGLALGSGITSLVAARYIRIIIGLRDGTSPLLPVVDRRD